MGQTINPSELGKPSFIREPLYEHFLDLLSKNLSDCEVNVGQGVPVKEEALPLVSALSYLKEMRRYFLML